MSKFPAAYRTTDEVQGRHLAIVRGVGRGTIFPLVFEETFLGRLDSNHVPIDDDRVSRVHAAVRLRSDGVYVEDLKSALGTFVNGNRLSCAARLVDGDEIVIGSVAFVFAEPS